MRFSQFLAQRPAAAEFRCCANAVPARFARLRRHFPLPQIAIVIENPGEADYDENEADDEGQRFLGHALNARSR